VAVQGLLHDCRCFALDLCSDLQILKRDAMVTGSKVYSCTTCDPSAYTIHDQHIDIGSSLMCTLTVSTGTCNVNFKLYSITTRLKATRPAKAAALGAEAGTLARKLCKFYSKLITFKLLYIMKLLLLSAAIEHVPVQYRVSIARVAYSDSPQSHRGVEPCQRRLGLEASLLPLLRFKLVDFLLVRLLNSIYLLVIKHVLHGRQCTDATAMRTNTEAGTAWEGRLLECEGERYGIQLLLQQQGGTG